MVTRTEMLGEPCDVEVDGVRVATWVLEPSSRRRGDVVLCHGTPWSSHVWGSVARALADNFRVFLWDMPGYGRSTMGGGVATDLATQARRLAALVDIWGLDRPHAAAHDIGGAVALRAHLWNGVEFSDLHLWDVVTLDPWGSPFFRLVADNADVFAKLPDALHAALVREYIRSAGPHNLAPEDIATLAVPWLDGDGQEAFYAQIASLTVTDTRPVVERLSSVRCPCRIGWGHDDPWIPVEQAYRLRDCLPGSADVAVLDCVGHLTSLEAASDVTAALLEWWG